MFYLQSPCNPLIDDYNENFYITDEVDISCIHCKRSLRRPKSVRKVDDLRLIFVVFYVPVLIPRLNSTDTSLQLSENIAVNRIYTYTGFISKET
jgi:hypothetical protein